MRKIWTAFLCTVFTAAFTSCEGYKCGTGHVVDKLTSKPLDSVFCEAITGVQTQYTDSAGTFELCNRMSGCVPQCKDISIQFSKPGYKTIVVENPEDAVIYLER